MDKSSGRPKRALKAPRNYSPDAYNFPKIPQQIDVVHSASAKRSRNIAVAGSINKWDVYKRAITRLAGVIARESHCIEVLQTEKSDSNYRLKNDITSCNEIAKSENKIRQAKETIMATFQQIEDEVRDHKVWLELSQEDENGNVEVENIMCSKCNLPDVEGNDILFCDRADCYRAYHQLCLDPPLVAASENEISNDEDWFCWHCECIDDSLDALGEITGTDYEVWQQAFPELHDLQLQQPSEFSSNSHNLQRKGGGDKQAGDSSESEDEDWIPRDQRENKRELVNKSDNVSIRSKQSGLKGEGPDSGTNSGSDMDSDDDCNSEDTSTTGSDEDEENDGEGDSNSNSVDGNIHRDDVSEAESESESDVDEGEVSGLLQDADMHTVDINALHSQPRTLRPRIKSTTTVETITYSESDVNKNVAKVVRGVVILGVVKEFVSGSLLILNSSATSTTSSSSTASSQQSSEYFNEQQHQQQHQHQSSVDSTASTQSESHLWSVVYEDDSTAMLNEKQFRDGLTEYATVASKLVITTSSGSSGNSNSYARDEDLASGMLDTANIITTKRRHKQCDYITMNQQMFGDYAIDASSSDESYGGDGGEGRDRGGGEGTNIHKRRRKKNKIEDSINNKDDDESAVYAGKFSNDPPLEETMPVVLQEAIDCDIAL